MKLYERDSGYLLVLSIGEELIESIVAVAKEKNLECSTVQAIGALKHFELGYFVVPKKEYIRKKFEETVELLNGQGNIAMKEESPFLHMHVSLGRPDFSVIGGHLFSGIVAVTAEIFLQPFPPGIRRTFDERTGLFLIDSSF